MVRDAAEFIIGPRFARTRWRLLTRRKASSRRLVARGFGLVGLEFLRDRSGDRGTRAQPVVIRLHGRPIRQFDRRGRHGPVDDGDEVGVGPAEVIEQVFPAPEIVLEIVEPPPPPAAGGGLSLRRGPLLLPRPQPTLSPTPTAPP